MYTQSYEKGRYSAKRRLWGVAGGVALFLAFICWFLWMSYETDLDNLVRANTKSDLEAMTHSVLLVPPLLPNGRPPRIRARVGSGSFFYATDLRDVASLTNEIEQGTQFMLSQNVNLPLCRIVGFTAVQFPGAFVDVSANVQYQGFLGSLHTVSVSFTIPDLRFKTPQGGLLPTGSK